MKTPPSGFFFIRNKYNDLDNTLSLVPDTQYKAKNVTSIIINSLSPLIDTLKN